jgi:hypothetical protein
MELYEGKLCLTLSGRNTSPVPRIDFSTNRKCINTYTRIHTWMINEAIKEATLKNDDYNLLFFEGMMVDNLSMADTDHINDYLFGDT